MIKTTRLKTSQVPKNITYDLTSQVDGVTQTFELPEKVYDLDQHYVLFNGQVYRNDGNHTFYTISADGMELTTLFDEAPRPGASYVLQFVKTEIAEGDGAATKSYVDGKVADEATARENADIALGQRIDTVIAASDVKDIVGTHADLEAYDTSTLGDNDIIKVLADETQSGKISYYRWNTTNSQFSLIGSEGPYQMALTAGTNISIDSDNVISATDTTYSNFVGTDGVDAGAAGLVPAPATTDADKFLKSDGTWDTAGSSITLYTTYGQNTDGAMTQKATTDLVYTAGDPRHINIGQNSFIGGNDTIFIGSEDSGTIGTGDNLILIGHDASSGTQGSSEGTGSESVAIGHSAKVADESVAVGHNANAMSGIYAVAIGASTTTAGVFGSTAIGYNSYAGDRAIAIGANTSTTARTQGAVAIGKVNVTGTDSVGINNAGTSAGKSVSGDYSIGIMGNVSSARSVAVGRATSVTEPYGVAVGETSTVSQYAGVAIGKSAKCEYEYGVGMGAYAAPRAQGVVDVSTGTTTNGYQGANDQTRTGLRVISGVHDGEQLHDAATVAQGNTLATSAPTTATAGVLGQLYTDTTAMHTYQLTAIDTTDPDNPSYTWTQRW